MNQATEQTPPLTAEALAQHFGRVQVEVVCGRCGAPGILFVRPEQDGTAPSAPTSWRCDGCEHDDVNPPRWSFREAGFIDKATRRLAALNIPESHARASLDEFGFYGDTESRHAQSAALGYARLYLNKWPSMPRVLVLHGPPGTSKLHLAYGIARALADHRLVYGRRVRARVLTPDLCSRRVASRHAQCQLLIVEQLTVDLLRDTSRLAMVRDLLHHRWCTRGRTIVTVDESGPAVDRLVEQVLPIQLVGPAKLVSLGAGSVHASRPRGE